MVFLDKKYKIWNLIEIKKLFSKFDAFNHLLTRKFYKISYVLWNFWSKALLIHVFWGFLNITFQGILNVMDILFDFLMRQLIRQMNFKVQIYDFWKGHEN
jgi:hypothetical protein